MTRKPFFKRNMNRIEETLYLLSIPRMRESIRKGMKEPLEKCSSKVEWGNTDCTLYNRLKKMRKN